MVGLWTLDYLCPSLILKLNSGQMRVENYNGRGTHIVKDPHTDQQRQSRRYIYRFVVRILYSFDPRWLNRRELNFESESVQR